MKLTSHVDSSKKTEKKIMEPHLSRLAIRAEIKL
jgi:hypothetical protein